MNEENLYPELVYNNRSEIKEINIEDSFSSIDYPDLNMVGRKYYREQFFKYWDGELDYELFEELSRIHSLEFNYKKTVYNNKYSWSKNYKGNLFWNLDCLQNITLEENRLDKLKLFLTPKENIDYKEAEDILGKDPNLIVATMTLLVNNYLSIIEEVRDYTYMGITDGERDTLRFVFTKEEEIQFFTGRELLKELNKKLNHPYLIELIKKTDEVITTFNMLLVAKLTRRHSKNLENTDALQEGVNGILRALEDFDIDLGVKFSTYATYWIVQKIRRAESNFALPIRIPVQLGDKLNRIKRAIYIKSQENPNLTKLEAMEEVLDDFGYSNLQKRNIRNSIEINQIYSLDQEQGNHDDESTSLHKYVSSEKYNMNKSIESLEHKNILKKLLENTDLSDVELLIIQKRYGILPDKKRLQRESTLQELGEDLGVTRERIRQIESIALNKLRKTASKLRFNTDNTL